MATASTCSINDRHLRSALALKGMRAFELAAKLGFHPSTLSLMVNGHQRAPVAVIARMEKLLGVEAGYLVGDDEHRDSTAR